MSRGTGIALKAAQWVLTAFEFFCAVSILSITSYIIAIRHSNDLAIASSTRAVEGIAGAAVLYTICGLFLLWCLAGISFFAFLAILIDLAFLGAFAYVASQNNTGSCSGYVVTLFGDGDVGSDGVVVAPNGVVVILPSLRLACQLETACFALAIVLTIFFFFSALLEVALWQHRRNERAFGPSPANNYTAGSVGGNNRRHRGFSFFRRTPAASEKQQHPDVLPMHATPADVGNPHEYNNASEGAVVTPGFQTTRVTDATNY